MTKPNPSSKPAKTTTADTTGASPEASRSAKHRSTNKPPENLPTKGGSYVRGLKPGEPVAPETAATTSAPNTSAE